MNDEAVGSNPTRLAGSSAVEHVRSCLDDVLSAHGIKALTAMQRVLTPKSRVQFLVVPRERLRPSLGVATQLHSTFLLCRSSPTGRGFRLKTGEIWVRLPGAALERLRRSLGVAAQLRAQSELEGWQRGNAPGCYPEAGCKPTKVQLLHPPQWKVVRSGAQLVLKTRPGVCPRVRLLYLPRFRAFMVAENRSNLTDRNIPEWCNRKHTWL